MHKDIIAHDEYLLKCVVSPDVTFIATTSADKTIRLWNIITTNGDYNTNKYELDKILTHHQRWVWDAVFSADSLYIGHNLTVSCVALNDSS